MGNPRDYPDRPFLAVSAAIARSDRLLVVRRAKQPAATLYTFPGGVVEAGETLIDAVQREVLEETGLRVEPLALAGHREFIARGEDGRVARHFVILCFAARDEGGDVVPSDEIAEVRWVTLAELAALPTTEGLHEIAAAALAQFEPQP